ncbi:hypothetical protein HALDL1_10665 [Halobacterium sp. DL1]|jgi:uncharacterized protein (TIGR04206 family)|nr:hypothetical protein HALDL1_10665 [Halobacterium sp. DL1]
MNRRRVGVVVLAGLLPWVVVAWPGGWYPIFSAGFLRVETLAFTSLPTYVARVGAFPSHLQAWPIAVLLWAGAVVTAAVDRVDSAVTVGLLALAGASVLSLSLSLSGQRGITAVPLGTLWLWAAAAVCYTDQFAD